MKGWVSTFVAMTLNIVGCAWTVSREQWFTAVLTAWVALMLLGLLLAQYLAKSIADNHVERRWTS